jgi:ArsR family transcriptional regulator
MNRQLYGVVKVFKALSDPTRVRILKLLLKQKSLCVCEIMQALDIPQARASRHLGILKEAGFLSDERHGLWVHYSIEKDFPNPYCERIAELLSNGIEDDALVREDMQRLKKAIKLGQVGSKKG